MDEQKRTSWLQRIEDIITVLEGSSIGELELSEEGTEIIIRRTPGMVLISAPAQTMTPGSAIVPTLGAPHIPTSAGVAIIAPMTGVYYSAASPTSPSFVNIGDIVQVGQIIALIEAMKVFNEVQTEVAGRVLALVANNGDVVQKGNVLLRIEPL